MPNIRLPDGRLAWVSDEQAKAIGDAAQVETPGEAQTRVGDERTAAYFDTAGQKAIALGQGAISGATAGISDHFFGDESKLRAQYNPGWRTVGNIAGVVGPALLTGGASLAEEGAAGAGALGAESAGATLSKAAGYTAPGLFAKAGAGVEKTATALLGESTIAKYGAKAAGRAAEGALYGAAGENAHAALSDDPLTIDSFMSAAGAGALLNVGLGALGDIAISAGSKAAARLAAKAETAASAEAGAAKASALAEAEGVYADAKEASRGAIEDAKSLHGQAVKAQKAAEASAEAERTAAIAEPAVGGGEVRLSPASSHEEIIQAARDYVGRSAKLGEAVDHAANVRTGGTVFNELQTGDPASAAARAVRAFEPLRKSVTAGEDAAAGVVDAETAGARQMGQPHAPPMPSKIPGMISDHRANIRAMALPNTLSGFGKAGPESLAATEKALGATGKGQAVLDRLDKMAKGLGIEPKPGQILQDIGAHVNDVAKMEKSVSATAKAAKSAPAEFIKSWGKKALVYGAVHGLGVPHSMAAVVAAMVTGAKSSTSGALDAIVASMAAPVGRAVIRLAPAASKLIRDHGTNVRKTAKDGIDQAHAQAISAADAMYHAVTPFVSTGSVKFASALQQKGMQIAQYRKDNAPKDPGTATMMGKTQWLPSDAQARDYHEVVWATEAPLDVIKSAAVDGRVSMIAAKAVWDCYPGLMAEFQARVLSSPEALQGKPYEYRNSLSAILRIPLDSLNSPEYIAKVAVMNGPAGYSPKSGGPASGGRSGSDQKPPQTQVDRLTS